MRTLKLVQPDGSIVEVHGYDATGRDLHIDGPLSELLINYRPSGSIVQDIFPIVPVGKQSDLFFEFLQSELWRIPDTTRAPMTAAKMVDLKVSSQTYFCKNYALATGITIEDRTNADDVLSLRESKGMLITDLLTLDWENRVATTVLNSSNVGTVTTVASGQWSNFETSGPLVDIDKAIRAVRAATGYIPNRAVLGWEAYNACKYNQTIRNLIFPAAGGGAGPGIPTPAQLAALFGLEQVLVGGVMKNTAAQNLPQNLSAIWGPHAFVYYAPPRPNKETPSYAYTFRWRAPGLPQMQVEDLGYDKRLKADLLDIGFYQDEKVTGRNLGVWISRVTLI